MVRPQINAKGLNAIANFTEQITVQVKYLQRIIYSHSLVQVTVLSKHYQLFSKFSQGASH